jgi:outer membrane protein OmpA-like peptidoglycan-associated protein
MRSAVMGAAAICVAMSSAALSQQTFTFTKDGFVVGEPPKGVKTTRRTVIVERYVPTIWVDPDGCEHWVMDDGFEGFMTPHVTRNGLPVCGRTRSCAVMASDQLFATDRATISAANKKRLAEFFRSSGAQAYIIEGHTDSRASDAYNLTLSRKRARAVAAVARSAGANVSETRGYGERVPKASNATPDGRAANRRVEIQCIK